MNRPQAETQARKQALRERIWKALEDERVARFPGAWGRIPNFVGAEGCARGLDRLEAWHRARVVKINPDAPQRAIRYRALREGKVLYMAVPRLKSLQCFVELDPDRIGRQAWWDASSIQGARRYGRPVTVEAMRPVDLIVCGSVAVTQDGGRIGKGGGYSDLEFALALAAEKITPETPILTSVHPLQVVDEEIPWAVHDIPVDYILTPKGMVVCRNRYPRPCGIHWDLLSPETLEAVPALQAREGGRRRREAP